MIKMHLMPSLTIPDPISIKTQKKVCLKQYIPIHPVWNSGQIPGAEVKLTEAKCERFITNNYKLLPQPHIYAANCWGDNRSYIEKALIQGEYINAIEQIIAATKKFKLV